MYLCDGKIGNEYKVEDIDLPVNIEKRFGGPWDDPWNLYRCSEQQKSGCPDCESQGNTLCTWAQYHKEIFLVG